MPLDRGSSKQAISNNIATEVKSGKDPKQAAAIAYSVAGQDDADSARQPDFNGWWEIQGNPLSLAGVFPYLGSKIPGAPDPNKFYMVYRPAAELEDPACINSLRLLPWINDHTLLGNDEENGETPAEKKGIGGVIGEQIYFDPNYGEAGALLANIKCLSAAQETLINSGKVELSLGYRCQYEYAPGVFNGVAYDYVQRCIRANHVASVDEGRMGPQVAVLDSIDSMAITFDSKEFVQMADENNDGSGDAGTVDVKALVAQVEAILPVIEALKKIGGAAADPAAAAADPAATDDDDPAAAAAGAAKPAAAGDPAAADGDDVSGGAKPATPAAAAADAEDDDKKTAAAMDAMEKGMATRNKRKGDIARQLSVHVGTFDHSAMTEREVVSYGVTKLGLKVPQGSDAATFLLGNLAGRPDPKTQATSRTAAVAHDSADTAPGFMSKAYAARAKA